MTIKPNKLVSLKKTASALVVSTSLAALAAVPAQAQQIEFWTQTYGDLISWKSLMEELTAEFEAESGIEVRHEIINWPTAFQTWLTVAQGGAAPDCADMYWLHSFSAIGGDQYGPLPINEYRDRWPDLEEAYFAGSLQDVFWNDDFYGVPWRVDIRPIMYRTDLFEEAGVTNAPGSWEEIVDAATELTKRDENGNVSQWGYSFGPDNPPQALVPYYWQAGGNFLSEDGSKATIDNEAMRTTLTWMRDMVWQHQVVSPEFMEQGYDPLVDFVSGTLAMVGSTPNAWGGQIDRDFPEIDGKWAMAIAPEGPAGNRDTYSGAGYFGVLRGTDNVEACVDWIAFLSRDDIAQRISEAGGTVSPERAVMESEFWSDRPWKEVVAESLDYGRTSQHPSPIWSALMSPESGAVIYDMMYDAIVLQKDIDEVVTATQARMQSEIDRTKTKE